MKTDAVIKKFVQAKLEQSLATLEAVNRVRDKAVALALPRAGELVRVKTGDVFRVRETNIERADGGYRVVLDLEAANR